MNSAEYCSQSWKIIYPHEHPSRFSRDNLLSDIASESWRKMFHLHLEIFYWRKSFQIYHKSVLALHWSRHMIVHSIYTASMYSPRKVIYYGWFTLNHARIARLHPNTDTICKEWIQKLKDRFMLTRFINHSHVKLTSNRSADVFVSNRFQINNGAAPFEVMLEKSKRFNFLLATDHSMMTDGVQELNVLNDCPFCHLIAF